MALEHRARGGDMGALRAFCARLEEHLDMEELLTVQLLIDGTGGL